jgi:hypothetical protein
MVNTLTGTWVSYTLSVGWGPSTRGSPPEVVLDFKLLTRKARPSPAVLYQNCSLVVPGQLAILTV